MKTRTELLNYLAENYNLHSYLEIGLQNRANNFNKIKCPTKTCVDPDPAAGADYMMSSDRFFEHWNPEHKFSLVFIDGLHTAEQVKKDFDNALNCLEPGGFIVMHDMLPVEEIHARVPRESKVWNGDTFRFAFDLQYNYGAELFIVDIDHGCGVVQKKEGNNGELITGGLEAIDWTWYKQNRQHLHIITADHFIDMHK
jgi:hypothetical protein